MRQIKFRAWAYANKVMFYPESDEGWDFSKGVLRALPNTELMQFTGLLDKNGKEIYEGDLIKGVVFGNVYPDVIAIVEFEDGMFRDSHWHKALEAHRGVMEVIGNIYENPELIK